MTFFTTGGWNDASARASEPRTVSQFVQILWTLLLLTSTSDLQKALTPWYVDAGGRHGNVDAMPRLHLVVPLFTTGKNPHNMAHSTQEKTQTWNYDNDRKTSRKRVLRVK